MKISQIQTLLMLLVCSSIFAQPKALATFPNGFYHNTLDNLKTSLNSVEHQRLFEAFEVAELEEILGMNGPFTVFAPTNMAFSNLSSKELDELFDERNKAKLRNVLTYHMVAGNLTASKILKALCRGKGEASFTTVQGTKIYATMQGTDIVLKDSIGNFAKITTADSEHSNGVIHQIDRVVLPFGL